MNFCGYSLLSQSPIWTVWGNENNLNISGSYLCIWSNRGQLQCLVMSLLLFHSPICGTCLQSWSFGRSLKCDNHCDITHKAHASRPLLKTLSYLIRACEWAYKYIRIYKYINSRGVASNFVCNIVVSAFGKIAELKALSVNEEWQTCT